MGVGCQAPLRADDDISTNFIQKVLLSEDEYLDQSRVETEKALRNLRDYCQSPKCSPWRLTSRLDSPTRFAEFVQGKI